MLTNCCMYVIFELESCPHIAHKLLYAGAVRMFCKEKSNGETMVTCVCPQISRKHLHFAGKVDQNGLRNHHKFLNVFRNQHAIRILKSIIHVQTYVTVTVVVNSFKWHTVTSSTTNK